MSICKNVLYKYSLVTWQKQLMASDFNLIDFSSEETNGSKPPQTATPMTSTTTSQPITLNAEIKNDQGTLPIASSTTTTSSKPGGKSKQSLFAITQVVTHGESLGADDSEFDDSISEHNESSSTPISDASVTQALLKETKNSITTSNNNNVSGTNLISANQIPQTTQHQNVPTSEPQSRFRIVKIAKQKPYERGTWSVNDFNDSQKQTESTSTDPNHAPSSPAVKRSRNPVSESGVVISPTPEPVKTKSSESFTTQFLQSQSRGSSVNTAEGLSSVDSTSVSDSNSSSTPFITPVVEALDGALDQIHTIKELMLVSVSDEMKKLRDSLSQLQAENVRLKEENDQLKKTLKATEDGQRFSTLEKG